MANNKEHKGITDIIPINNIIILLFKGILMLITNAIRYLFGYNKYHRQTTEHFFNFRQCFKDIYFINDEIDINEKSIFLSNHIPNFDVLYILETLEYITNNQKHFCMLGAPKMWIINKIFEDYNQITIKNPDSNPDNINLIKKLSKNIDQILVVFPEGLHISPKTYPTGLSICQKYNIQPFTNLLPPAPKGLYTLLKNQKYKYIYDITISFDGYQGGYDLDVNTNLKLPSFQSIASKDQSGGFYIRINKIPIKDVYKRVLNSDGEIELGLVADYLIELWREKDIMLSNFVNNKVFSQNDPDFVKYEVSKSIPQKFNKHTYIYK